MQVFLETDVQLGNHTGIACSDHSMIFKGPLKTVTRIPATACCGREYCLLERVNRKMRASTLKKLKKQLKLQISKRKQLI